MSQMCRAVSLLLHPPSPPRLLVPDAPPACPPCLRICSPYNTCAKAGAPPLDSELCWNTVACKCRGKRLRGAFEVCREHTWCVSSRCRYPGSHPTTFLSHALQAPLHGRALGSRSSSEAVQRHDEINRMVLSAYCYFSALAVMTGTCVAWQQARQRS